jgi:hypothetical protein
MINIKMSILTDIDEIINNKTSKFIYRYLNISHYPECSLNYNMNFPQNFNIMICGYSGTGKDTFFNYLLIRKNLIKINNFWTGSLVYCHKKMKSLFFNLNTPMIRKENIFNFKFSNTLQKQMMDLIEIKNYNQEKDTRKLTYKEIYDIEQNYYSFKRNSIKIDSSNDNPLIRDGMIYIAKCMKDNDPEFYIKTLMHQLVRTLYPIRIITDFRFKNEYNIVKYLSRNIYNETSIFTTTIRLYRKLITTKKLLSDTEHELDDFFTDLLIVPNREDYEDFCDKLPIMKDQYIPVYRLL